MTEVQLLGFIIKPGQIQMDHQKVQAVVDWPIPSSVKEVQRFLGFAKFYRKFILNFSTVAAPLSALTKGNTTSFYWGPEAEFTFRKLKSHFTSAPILMLPDPDKPFIVEVDTSDVGIGAVLSQRDEDNKLHPCAFLSHRLTPTERNYHLGDRELLAVKLALEEWRHWLEGAKHPVQVLTDHKNLEYIQQAKRLNPHQARWSLFFNRFQLILSYRPGSKNLKPNTLSRVYGNTPQEDSVASIIPSTKIIAPMRWDLENTAKQAQTREPDPGGGPTNCLFVPKAACSQVLQWGHSSRHTCHPGASRTLEFLQRRFWWPTVINACLTCNQSKVSHHSPQGLLHPLSIPHRPWSHLSMDFITGLPLSQGNTTILVVVDRLSKAARFIPQPKLPTAKETAELVRLQRIVRWSGRSTSVTFSLSHINS